MGFIWLWTHFLLIKYFFKHTTNLTLYNETYAANTSGRYAGSPLGAALFHDQHT